MSPIIELPYQECLKLLRSSPLGRVALTTPMGPRIVPVNYRVQDGDVVLRTTPTSLLGTYGWDTELAFEVDHVDERKREGWSVVALGKGELVEDVDEVTRIWLQGDPEPWADGQRNAYLRLHVRELTGRRVGGDVTRSDKPVRSLLAHTYLG
jgi:hypothetical protein